MFPTQGLPVSQAGALDIQLSRPASDPGRRAIKEAAVGAVDGASALWLPTHCRVAAPGRLARGQAAHPALASRRRFAGAADQTQNRSAWYFNWVAHHGDASEPCLDVGLHRGCDGARRGFEDADHLG